MTAQPDRIQVTVTLPERTARLLAVLGGDQPGSLVAAVAPVLAQLADHAQQGVYRPMAWERDWVIQAFGDGWLDRLEPDTGDTAADGRVVFDRPRGGGQQ